ncbi:hypothetical protein ACFYNO_07285 [Kitasatospora sp. NPDC006697]|uniref:hypothetical protein n=1 Tax=Kitasatospora sp. NPDC006697 TaxID=3364020 RepID=UPI0036B45959
MSVLVPPPSTPAPLESRRAIRWAALSGALVPPVVLALAVLMSDPDWETPGLVLGLVLACAAPVPLLLLRPGKLIPFGVLLLTIGVLIFGNVGFTDLVLQHRGQQVEVRVASVRTAYARNGNPTFTCVLERVDGVPLAHSGTDDCTGTDEVGRTEQVLIDPAGWVAPQSAGDDLGDGAPAMVAALTALLLAELLVWLAHRLAVQARRHPGPWASASAFGSSH